jgi:peptide/nickel transport system permease protein
LAIAVMSVLVPSLRNVVIVLALSSWVVYARLVRARTLQILSREHVVAARALGCSPRRLVFRHVVPNLVPSILIVAAVQFGQMVVAESSLSYLGLGVQPPTPTWGGMISEGREYVARAWWIITFPGVSLVVTVLGISFLGEWLRDVMDPTLNTGRL